MSSRGIVPSLVVSRDIDGAIDNPARAGAVPLFAGLGMGRVLLPLLAGTARLGVTALAVLYAAKSASGVAQLALLIGLGTLVSGAVNALAAYRTFKFGQDTQGAGAKSRLGSD
jgi:hypothetical protein